MTKLHPTSIPVLGLFLLASPLGCDKGSEPAKDKTVAAAPTPSTDDKPEAAKPAPNSEQDAPEEEEPVELSPEVVAAAKVAEDLEKAPSDVDRILAEADLDAEELDALLYEIAADPELTEQYRIARSMSTE